MLRLLELRLLSLRRDVEARVRPQGRVATREPSPAAVHTQPTTAPQAAKQTRPLRFRPVLTGAEQPARLRFTPTRRQADRILLTNWNTQVGFVSVGDVELELEPGQSAAVWIDRADPGPFAADEPAAPRESLYFLSDEHAGSII
jgi:hypothetical protein